MAAGTCPMKMDILFANRKIPPVHSKKFQEAGQKPVHSAVQIENEFTFENH